MASLKHDLRICARKIKAQATRPESLKAVA